MSEPDSSFEVSETVEPSNYEIVEIQEPEPTYQRTIDSAHLSIFHYVGFSTLNIRALEIRITPNSVVKSVDYLYPTRVLYRLMNCYLACLFMEYLLSIGQLPFEHIKNRPLMCQFNAFYGCFSV